eukprot:Awhi_evm1s5836
MFMIEPEQKFVELAKEKGEKPLQFALKPMNCPGHFLMFGHRVRSHKELPL